MANRFFLSEWDLQGDPPPNFELSNGATGVLADLLVTAASEVAGDDRQLELTAWLARRLDQSLTGRGTVCFSLTEMPWSVPVDDDRNFWLEVCDVAAGGRLWHRLGIDAGGTVGELWRQLIAQFRDLVAQISDDLIVSPPEPPSVRPAGYCGEHGAVPYAFVDEPEEPARCVVCGDLGDDAHPEQATDEKPALDQH